jgi:hypothetical protein
MVHKWQNEWNPCGDWNDAILFGNSLKDSQKVQAVKLLNQSYSNFFNTTPKGFTIHCLKAKGISVEQ